MPRILRDRKTLFGALLASLALHALAMPFFARSSISPDTGFGASGPQGNERVRSTTLSRISIESRRAIPVARVPARTAKPFARRAPALVTPQHARPAASVVVATGTRQAPASAPRVGNGDPRAASRARGAIAITIATAPPEDRATFSRPSARERSEIAAPVTPPPTPTPRASPESTPVDMPSPTAPARVVANRTETGMPTGGWGASFENPLVADENALDDLRARYRGARAIRIDVDEAGHATRVVVPASVSPELRVALERDLLALRYVPAECNGLRCGGSLQLSL